MKITRLFFFAAVLFLLFAKSAQAQVVVRVSAAQEVLESPLYVEVPASRWTHARTGPVPKGAITAPCQSEPAGAGKVRLTWMVRDLPAHTVRLYLLRPTDKPAPNTGVDVRQTGANVDVFIAGKLFTRYDTTTGPNKPYFYPVNAPNGVQIVRRWPVENVPGETRDHPHHRGLWFTHGDVNGVDFWTEGAKTGKTVHTGYNSLRGGAIYGVLQTKTDWVAPGGKKLATDTRDVRIYAGRTGYWMDFSVTVTAVGGPMVWGDTKEGTFGLRVADALIAEKRKEAPDAPLGFIENAKGETQGKTWGRPAAWCDFYGPLGGETMGIAIFDGQGNLRHPTTWQVRPYGLFAANPFGLHDFDPARKTDTHGGDLTLPEGQSRTWTYRLYFHRGSTQDARIAQHGSAYVQPPRIEVLP